MKFLRKQFKSALLAKRKDKSAVKYNAVCNSIVMVTFGIDINKDFINNACTVSMVMLKS